MEDADATAEKVKAAGGSVFFGPADLPNEAGRVAMLRDPSGAFIGIVQQNRNPGAQLVNEPGTWTWSNLMTRDLDGAQDFYSQVFGWSAIHNEEAPPGILMWQVEGQRWPEGMAGVMEMTDDMPAGDARPLAGLLHRRERRPGDRAGHLEVERSSASARSTSRWGGWRPWSTRRGRSSRSSRRTIPSRASYRCFAGAGRAEPADDHLGAIGLEAGARGGAAGALQVERGLHVLDPAAVAADHVVVGVGAGVPEEGAATAVHPPDDAELLEELECRVDGRQRDAGQALARLGEELLGAHVPGAVAEQPVHDDPLRGRPQAALAQKLGELGVIGRGGVSGLRLSLVR